MRKILLLFLLLTGIVKAQIVNIPDAHFKAELLSASPTVLLAQNFSDQWVAIDTNNDGEIQVSEAQAIKLLIVSRPNILNIDGISAFSNVEILRIRLIRAPSLDIHGLPDLKTLSFMSTQYLAGLNLYDLPVLATLELIGNESLTALDLHNVPSLKGLMSFYCPIWNLNINGLTNLTYLNVTGNMLTSLDVTGSPNLETLNCSNNLITNLNVNDLEHLTDLDCSGNRLLNLNGIPNVTKLNCSRNKLTTFLVGNLTNLTELDCSGNDIANLNLNSLTNLTKLNCSYNKLVTFTLSGLPDLTTFDCTGNTELTTVTLANLASLNEVNVMGAISGQSDILTKLTSLNLSGLPALNKLNCSYGLLTTLSLSNLSSLTELTCSYNQITSLNLSNLPNLKRLDCSVNPIASLDASDLSSLEDLVCANGYIVNGMVIGNLQSLNVAGLSNLKTLNCLWNLLPTLDLTGLTSLEYLTCDGLSNGLGTLTSLNVNHLSNLKSLSCSNQKLTSLNVSNLTQLEMLYCAYNQITNLDLTGLTSLKTLDYNYNLLSNLNLVNLPSLQSLTCSNNQLVTLNVLNLTALKSLNCSFNELTTLNLSGLSSLETLDYSFNQLTLSNVSGLSTNLKSLTCAGNNLTSLDVSGLTSLETLSCRVNELTNLDLSTLFNLKSLDCSGNQLSSLGVSHMANLESLNFTQNLLTELNISGLSHLFLLYCGDNQLTSLDLSDHLNLVNLDYSLNALPDLDLVPLTNLNLLGCTGTQTTTLDVSNMPNLQHLFCDNNQLTTLNVNNNSLLNEVHCANNLLTTLFMKNGRNHIIDFGNNPTLQYICVDTAELEQTQTVLNNLGMDATVSNTYCTFAPGGDFNSINGIAIFDADNNGCDVTDEVNPFVRFDINDGTTTGATVTNINGEYGFFTNVGTFTVSPNVENQAWFTFSPPSAEFTFLNNDNNIGVQNFCMAAVGTHADVEVVVSPIEWARPGFDATYKIVYKNKGNQMLSGSVSLAFDDTKLDLVTAFPATSATSTNSLSWNYVNLMPFENRSITVILNVNAPTETPAVNNGDILTFVASVTPTEGDEVLSDNQFSLAQTVVGSFDPNAKTCLEGNVVSPSHIGDYLHYNIQFENLGTAEAVNVVVKDVIDASKFDISTLQVLYSSHPMRANIRGNIAEFVFQNISLAPAAGDPPVGGHGNVLFKIKTLPTLEVGTMVENTANIFFDYNAPIDTDPARTVFESLGVPDVDIDKTVSVYPNPTNSILNIKSEHGISKVELFDVQGRILQSSLQTENTAAIDLSQRTNGVYFVRIFSDAGVKVIKAVKE